MFEFILISLLQRLLSAIIPYLQTAERRLQHLLHQNDDEERDKYVTPLILTASEIEARSFEGFAPGTANNVYWRTLISRDRTPSDSLTVGKAVLPPMSGQLCPHAHQQAEVYHILSGKGAVTLGEGEREVNAGDVVYIPGDERHGIRNLSEKEELTWMYYFACDGFEDVKYRF
ncbi:RmlC-like cupin domain-containing protein [Elsinoe ampelina]|uniref:RmlC-like cupin domain-containing protein n=1 Tax=Elsinoe ampelina TaxID=302913 RepID=A0A6A6GNB1_9PEZI|nr:RmlC-like cupin domain-containing protein [Elsinoe ampelina]